MLEEILRITPVTGQKAKKLDVFAFFQKNIFHVLIFVNKPDCFQA
jgi:hypothetical protein